MRTKKKLINKSTYGKKRSTHKQLQKETYTQTEDRNRRYVMTQKKKGSKKMQKKIKAQEVKIELFNFLLSSKISLWRVREESKKERKKDKQTNKGRNREKEVCLRTKYM